MAAGVVLDTSFLITLADATRVHHPAAREYWRHFTENGMPIFLSTIVVSEFCIRQEIPAEILRSCVVLPFNWDDAIRVAKLDFTKARQSDESRDALKDDVKIIAQAFVKDAGYVITDDTRTFYRYAQQLATSGVANFKPIKLEDGFDPAFFNGGQCEFSFDDSEADPTADLE
jgi:predicted nucleic acid-binding protein